MDPCVHAGENIFKRDCLDGPGVDCGGTSLNFSFPSVVDFGVAGAIADLKQLSDEPVEFAGREAARIFEDLLSGAVHEGIVARNRFWSGCGACVLRWRESREHLIGADFAGPGEFWEAAVNAFGG